MEYCHGFLESPRSAKQDAPSATNKTNERVIGPPYMVGVT